MVDNHTGDPEGAMWAKEISFDLLVAAYGTVHAPRAWRRDPM